MKIEIVEFYPIEKKKEKAVGSLHVYLCDLGMDLRGIMVYKKNRHMHIDMPSKWGCDDDGKFSCYPIITFTDMVKNKEVRDQIIKKGKAFVEKWLAAHPEDIERRPMPPKKPRYIKKEVNNFKPIAKPMKKREFVDFKPGNPNGNYQRKFQKA